MGFRTRRPAGLAAIGEDEQMASLLALTYELLDAHADTARLAGDDAGEDEWRRHLDYLRDLQRVGREALARAGGR